MPHNLCAPPAFDYFRRMTTDVGIWQHANGEVPNVEEGYSIDDVARALIVVNDAVRLFPVLNAPQEGDPRSLEDLADISLAFLERFQRVDGLFHNFVSKDGRALDDIGSKDSFGRTMWALGETVRRGVSADHQARALAIIQRAQPHVRVTPFLRTNMFLMLGVVALRKTDDALGIGGVLANLVDDTLRRFSSYQETEWTWFEESLRYSNGAVPFTLFRASEALHSDDPKRALRARDVARATLDFLLQETTVDGLPVPIGNRGWYERGKKRALYDQQPVDAAAMTLAALEAYRVTHEQNYRDQAEQWLRWYEGHNVLHLSLLEQNGAVHDGINEGKLNANCGAEAVVTYLLARLAWKEQCCVSS